MINLSKNSGLSKNSHISDVLKTLKIYNIHELYLYMKLIFVKNLKNNFICKKIFEYLLIANYKDKSSTKSFLNVKNMINVCLYVHQNEEFVINNINLVIKEF
jgi:hypothetical protein